MGNRLARVTAAVLGCLLETPEPMRQTEIAAAVEATQARVSQVLGETDRAGLTVRSGRGWLIISPAAAFDICANQPSRAPVTGWYSLEPGLRQVESCIDSARQSDIDYRVSGDWAADRLAPWRIPRLGVVHIDRQLDLESAGFVPSELIDATLHTLISPLPGQWRTDPRIAARLAGSHAVDWRFAPVHDIARQILAAGDPDAVEAVAELRDRFLAARSAIAAEALST